ncbi:MAG: flagellar hook-length control protein FliK [Alphaproteobacteria bacterium]|nr:flagellar hook-length control protein FliK [Alphaproteobacteria bacterium]
MSNFSAAVAERMMMSGPGFVDRGQNGLSQHLTNVRADTQNQVKKDVEPKRMDAAPRDDHQPRDRAETPETAEVEAPRAAVAKDDAPRQNAGQDDHAARDANARNDARDTDAPQASSGDANASQQDKTQPTDNAAKSAGDGQQTATGETVSVESNAAAQAQQVLAAVVDTVQANANASDAGKQNAGQGLEKAQAAVAGEQIVKPAATEGDDGLDLNLANQGAKQQKADSSGQQQAQTQAKPQVEVAHGQDPSANLKQQQAADLAKAVGQNQKVEVTVNVTKQAEQLTSQPTNAAAVQVAVAEDGDLTAQTNAANATAAKPSAQTAQIVNTHGSGNPQGQNGQDAQGQAQQQLQMAQNEAAKGAANGAAKAAQTADGGQAAQTAAQVVKVGGAEGVATTQPGQNATQTNTAQHAANAHKPAADPHAQARAQVTEQVNVQITKAIQDGMDKIRIQLRPAHLGRVEVQLEMASDGRVTAVVTADNKDTLDLLKQDSRELERAMREAGLQLNSGDLSFNLRGNGAGDGNGQDDQGNGGRLAGGLTKEPTLDELLQANSQHRDIISDDRVDIRA